MRPKNHRRAVEVTQIIRGADGRVLEPVGELRAIVPAFGSHDAGLAAGRQRQRARTDAGCLWGTMGTKLCGADTTSHPTGLAKIQVVACSFA
jgi:hypothetical protein